MTAIVALLAFSHPVMAAPEGGVVTSGSASINQAGTTTTINQASNKATINWQRFSIAPAETVNFNQPSTSAIALNRVIGNERSVIEGALNANGKVFLVNSAGVLIGRGGRVNTGGFVASTRDISDSDFNAGKYSFSGSSDGSVINLGTITVNGGGYVVLLGKTVSNQGAITATKGTVSMNGADKVTLNFNGDSLVGVTLDQGTLDALVENKGAIYADGGSVILTAKAADDLLTAQVNNTGLIHARTVDDLKGNVTLYAHGGTTMVDGTIDASAPTAGDGGFVETSGDVVNVADSAFVTTKSAHGTTGTWLIDPNDFTIAASGGNMTGTALKNALESNNYTISTATQGTAGGHGDITVNDTVDWNANTTLTLNAERDININAPIIARGAGAGVALTYGGDYNIRTKASYAGTTTGADGYPVAQTDTSGGVYGSITFKSCTSTATCTTGTHPTLTINGQTYILVGNVAQIATTGTLTGYYALADNLDATSWSAANTSARSVIATFGGTFAGLGHTVDNLTFNGGTGSSGRYTGFIGQIASDAYTNTIRDIGITNINVKSSSRYVGALVGSSAYNLTVTGAYSTGVIAVGSSYAGGLLGFMTGAATIPIVVDNAYSTVTLTSAGANYVGGLIGSIAYGSVTHTNASGNVTSGTGGIGGLIGSMSGTVLSDSYATGAVTAPTPAANVSWGTQGYGGLVGYIGLDGNMNSTITRTFATGAVTAGTNVGGLVGLSSLSTSNTSHLIISYSYVSGPANIVGVDMGGFTGGSVGGLIGSGSNTTLDHVYSTKNVVANGSLGLAAGLAGVLLGTYTVSNSYATGNVTASGSFSGAAGLVGSTGEIFNSGGEFGTITNSYATGEVTAGASAAGLVGTAGYLTISNSYASGSVAATSANGIAGGLVAQLAESGHITDSHATGAVSGNQMAGGLVGYTSANGSIINSWANNTVTGTGIVGALVGRLSFNTTISNSYWNQGRNHLSNAVGEMTEGVSGASIINSRGLTDGQFADLQFYLNGTIDQVLAGREEQSRLEAERAAEAAAADAAARAAAEAAAADAAARATAEAAARAAAEAAAEKNLQRTATSQANQTVATATQNVVEQPRPQTLTPAKPETSQENSIVFSDSAHYFADLESIGVNGREYDLNEDGKK